jgi:hypothetical protein
VNDGQDPDIAFTYAKRMIRQEIEHHKAWVRRRTSFTFGTKVREDGKTVPNIIKVL